MSGDGPSIEAAPRTQETASARLGPGVLIFVVGPSGAGKDTLLTLAAASLAGRARVHFARRLVTRAEGANEAHGTLSTEEFERDLTAGRFPLSWRAHGLSYALGPDVKERIAAGDTVVANGSRATLPLARERFISVRVVEITAPAEVRAARLAARGRESASDIRERLERTPLVDLAPDLVIDNVGSPQDGAARLAAFIAGIATGA